MLQMARVLGQPMVGRLGLLRIPLPIHRLPTLCQALQLLSQALDQLALGQGSTAWLACPAHP